MCGIFGVFAAQGSGLSFESAKSIVKKLFLLSQSRGKEASGLAVRCDHSINVLKEPVVAARFVKLTEYKQLFEENYRLVEKNSQKTIGPYSIIGHSRLVTNGTGEFNLNNQPVVKDGAVGVHNGIIVNDADLWKLFPGLKRKFEVDTEIFLSLLQEFRKQNASFIEAVRNTYRLIKGTASVSILFADIEAALLATNNGSLFYCTGRGAGSLVFASEKYILQQVIGQSQLADLFDVNRIVQIKAGNGCIYDPFNLQVETFGFASAADNTGKSFPVGSPGTSIHDFSRHSPHVIRARSHSLSNDIKDSMIRTWERLYSSESNLRRCSRCLLPQTIPFISFDSAGVCNYCRNYERRAAYKVKGEAALEEFVAPYRSASGQPDCIVGFSGGRDSTYALYYVKNILRMNPIAFTFDWGMLTDLGRRNQSKVCSDLGVENILISADIQQKRKNIQRNLLAWLKKPELGMVPLLMAGDKQFYHYFHAIRKQTGVKLFIFAGGHKSEEDPFKYGFCGVKHGTHSIMDRITAVSLLDKIKLMFYVGRNYITNPAYINLSIPDTLFAYYCTYILPDDYLYLFEYIQWDEDKVISTIREKFDWEMAGDTIATWRIDDGTAPFYNYIYMTIAGFTEFDHFRSTQIRDGKLAREKALKLVQNENRPRFEAIEWYANAVDFDCNRAISIINSVPKLYSTK